MTPPEGRRPARGSGRRSSRSAIPRLLLATGLASALLACTCTAPRAPAVPGAAREAPPRAPVESPPPAPSLPATDPSPAVEPAPVPAPARVVMSGEPYQSLSFVHFFFGSAVVPPDAEPFVRDVADTMSAHPEIALVAVEGHVDVKEGQHIRGDLSRRRAEAVRDRLGAKGVEPVRLIVVAHGSAKPIADNATPEGRASNRRVQFHVEEKRDP